MKLLLTLFGLVAMALDNLERVERQRCGALTCAGCHKPGGPICISCLEESGLRLAWATTPGNLVEKTGLRTVRGMTSIAVGSA